MTDTDTTEIILRKQNERLRIISKAAGHLLASDNPDTMVSDLFRQVSEHLNVDTYFNFMVGPEGDVLHLDSCGGIPPEVARSIDCLSFGEAVCGNVALYQKPIIASYIQESDDPKVQLVKSLGLRAYACNPLIAGGRLLGTLSFATRTRDSFSEDELDFLRTICHYVSLAKERTIISDRLKKANEALLDVNRKKDEFLANMSHEIRTPMNAVIGLSHILSLSRPLTERQRECLSTLQVSAQSLLSLINDLLDIAKIESKNVQLESHPFNLQDLLNDVISINTVRADEKQISLTGQYEVDLPEEFIGDSNRLKQVLMNLISNAIKFTDQGLVAIKASAKNWRGSLCEVEISISDSGIGIPANKLESIFSKFSQADSSITRKYGGTGLGLPIAKTLIELMGGTITVSSDIGKGSTFRILLPLAFTENKRSEKLSPALNQEPLASVEDQAPYVLLVEDSPPNVFVATIILENLGYRFEVANNGEDALEKIKKRQFDIILMDVQMPGMDGFSTTQHIRKHESENGGGRMPIIGVTAYALSGDKEKCLRAGMDDYLSKPFNPDVLENKIKNFLEKPSMRVAG
ncbi:MAG: ATP-binding protein [Rickettsiales bacterium]